MNALRFDRLMSEVKKYYKLVEEETKIHEPMDWYYTHISSGIEGWQNCGDLSKYGAHNIGDTFLLQTGHEYFKEMTNDHYLFDIHSRMDGFYVEFNDAGVLINFMGSSSERVELTEERIENNDLPPCNLQGVEVRVLPVDLDIDKLNLADDLRRYVSPFISIQNAELYNTEQKHIYDPELDRPPVPVDCPQIEPINEGDWMLPYAYMVLGVMCLMEERLIVDTPVIFPGQEAHNLRRKRKGKKPINKSEYKILSLNLSECRKRTARVRMKKHESPRLHWRRGHWRTLHRYTADEKQTWIKKMLVGDPDKGVINKHYQTGG